MIYFIVTTSLFKNCDIRKMQYTNGIEKLKKTIKKLNIECKIIIVENNGLRKTFLDEFDCDVFYTNNNNLKTSNKGVKELKDVFDTIIKYNIKDDDFIIKMTGRYILNDDSEFMNTIKNINHTKYSCVIKYGSYMKPLTYKTNDCITGIIGMKCLYVKQIKFPKNKECVEWEWAKIACLIEEDKVFMVDKLGINICPGCNNYFSV